MQIQIPADKRIRKMEAEGGGRKASAREGGCEEN
jgi:hypothetical protein